MARLVYPPQMRIAWIAKIGLSGAIQNVKNINNSRGRWKFCPNCGCKMDLEEAR